MLHPGDRVLVAVSGGPDSVCLLDIMAELSNQMKLDLVIAHYNHGLRGLEDENEDRLVEKLAEKYGLPIECERASDLNVNMASLEEMARKSRYAFLERVKSRQQADKIALGHNLNDQAETFLMRLFRGSGMKGLSGIPPIRDGVFIRPLIETGREEILDYLDSCQIEYAIDSSNSEKKFLRNRVRLELIPELLKYQPNLVENLGKLSSHMREENEYINSQAEIWVEEELQADRSGEFYIKLTAFKRLPDVFLRRVLRLIISRFIKYLHGVDAGHIDSILELSRNPNPSASIHLPKGLIVKREYGKLLFSLDEDCFDPFNYIIDAPCILKIKETGQELSIEKLDRMKEEPVDDIDPGIAFLNCDKIRFPLTVRNFKPGDKFIPLGMKGHKKVKDYFIDCKIPLRDRRKAPILLSGDKIACICGHRIDNRFKVGPNTKTILRCQLLHSGI